MLYRKSIIPVFIALSALIAKSAAAVCPVCTVAVGAGLGLAQWLGIDDSISGLWIGALIVSVSVWTINWLNGKNIKFKGRKILVFVAYYLLVVAPLWAKGLIGHPYNKLCGIDKLLFGIILGSMIFAVAAILHLHLFKKNEGKSYFRGQKIALPVASLIITSLILYYIC